MLSLSLVAGPCILLFLIYKYLIYPTFLSPLSKTPNAHPTSSFSPFWILWKRYSDQENRCIHAAHEKHGDIVRLGPNEVSVACVDDGIRTIYSGGFEKWAWYENQFHNYGIPNMFSMTASKAHSTQKRMISNVYSKSYLQSSPEVHKISQTMIFDRLLPLLDDASAERKPLEVLELNYSSTMDFIIAFIFGLQNCSNFLPDAETRKHWLAVYASTRPYRFWSAEALGFHTFLRKIGIYLVPKWIDEAYSEIEDWTLEKCKAAQKSLMNPPSTSQSQQTQPIVYAQLASAFPPRVTSSKDTQPDLRIATELLDHLAAGHETSGITLTYLMHELSLHPTLQHQLRKECLTLNPPLLYPSNPQDETTIELPSARDIDALPLLHALMMETLRIHAPIPGPQPRITPSTGTTLANHPLPPGVRVSAQAYTLHRNASVFPSPTTWDPSRWLTATPAQKAEMHRWFWAFGSGGRMCIGNNFAMQEMKLIVAAVYTNFETRVVDDGGMEQGDGYTVGPKGGRLVLGFERVGG